jgi:CheY-like chemotaxis protein
MLDQLFQPFNRLGQEGGSEEGTGIGLVVAKRLIELMGGTIGAESEAGVGSEFWFELAADVAPRLASGDGETALIDEEQSVNGAKKHNLLYVEDNPANMKLVEQLIARRSDLHLMTAVTGYLGIEIARTSMPEMILMDINLPDISGIEVLKILHNDPATAHIPIVALSANAMPRDIEKGLAAGFFRYLTKPIKVNEFMDTLNAALSVIGKETTPAGVSNIHKQDTSEVIPESVIDIPNDLIIRLQEATIDADHDQLLLLVQEVEPYNRMKSKQLKRSLEAFDYQSLLDTLKADVK